MQGKLERLKTEAPALFEWGRIAKEVLESYQLIRHDAKVALCFDISGTMHSSYTTGAIQAFTEKMLAMACILDADQKIDVFLFGDEAYYVDPIRPENITNFIESKRGKYYSVGGTHFDKIIRMVREFYFPGVEKRAKTTPMQSEEPVFVLLITDGNTVDEKAAETELRHASYEPIFWQFMAIGSESDGPIGRFMKWFSSPMGDGFSFLDKIDTMEERNVDNVGFFSVKSPFELKEEELYALMMKEYPDWLKLAVKAGLVK